MDIQPLVDALQPWASLYSDHPAVATGVLAAHLLALLFGGGLAIAADRATLRALDDDATLVPQLASLAGTHRPVLLWLGVIAVSGSLMTAADLGTYWTSTAYIIKQTLVFLLLANGAFLVRTERALERALAGGAPDAAPLRVRLRLASWLSLLLWGATTLAGVALTNFA